MASFPLSLGGSISLSVYCELELLLSSTAADILYQMKLVLDRGHCGNYTDVGNFVVQIVFVKI